MITIYFIRIIALVSIHIIRISIFFYCPIFHSIETNGCKAYF